MVNLATLTGTSYSDANTWVLLLLLPGLLGLLLLVRLWQRRYLRRLAATKTTRYECLLVPAKEGGLLTGDKSGLLLIGIATAGIRAPGFGPHYRPRRC